MKIVTAEVPDTFLGGNCGTCDPEFACNNKFQDDGICPLFYAKDVIITDKDKELRSAWAFLHMAHAWIELNYKPKDEIHREDKASWLERVTAWLNRNGKCDWRGKEK